MKAIVCTKYGPSEEIKPIIDRTCPFEQIVGAHRYVDKRHKREM